jgi:hypothetical protein
MERYLVEAFFEKRLMPHQARMLGWCEGMASADGKEGVVIRVRVGASATELPFQVQPEKTPGMVWLFPSPSPGSPLSTRTLGRRISALGRSFGFHVTCTSIRLATRREKPKAA